eukprot:1990952-Lingulodinium_polyedra.AAC.1
MQRWRWPLSVVARQSRVGGNGVGQGRRVDVLIERAVLRQRFATYSSVSGDGESLATRSFAASAGTIASVDTKSICGIDYYVGVDARAAVSAGFCRQVALRVRARVAR